MNHRRPLSKNAGFTLIEILVAVIILSIGLIGMAGLQATALKNNVSANQRTKANMLAASLIDRIRATSDSGDAIAGFVGQSISATNNFVAPAACSAAAPCAQPVMAAYELYSFGRFELGVSDDTDFDVPVLPGVFVHICGDTTPYDENSSPAAPGCTGNADPLVVKIWWNDDRLADDADNTWQLFSTPFRVVR